ncbi:uncharacterized protein LOC123718144 isoform X2 [Pieris brassicae]|uniref:Secreted protein n=1 Tax=Pieris brassicae TaxID=7116 RepID=A0A9P0TSZ6_PIEBR|nr:uncharacterized protein LOC123718144 isoform X2 [Pieris brassicae]CAH4034305.1 unnamed protein product [Pieris brassicae]
MNLKLQVLFLIVLCLGIQGKSSEERLDIRGHVKSDATALIFADEFKQTIEKYLFGICPQPYKMPLGSKTKNGTTFSCDLDTDHQDLAARLATLALRAHSASRSDCLRLGAALANTLGDLARTAANQQNMFPPTSAAETKKRKLSKSQKMQIKAKQRTALAVKKKAAANAAAAAAKMTS